MKPLHEEEYWPPPNADWEMSLPSSEDEEPVNKADIDVDEDEFFSAGTRMMGIQGTYHQTKLSLPSRYLIDFDKLCFFFLHLHQSSEMMLLPWVVVDQWWNISWYVSRVPRLGRCRSAKKARSTPGNLLMRQRLTYGVWERISKISTNDSIPNSIPISILCVHCS